jgi:uncharacterized protein (TIGR02145 family)
MMKKLHFFFLLLPFWGLGGFSWAQSVKLIGSDFTTGAVTFTVDVGAATPTWVIVEYTTDPSPTSAIMSRATFTEASCTPSSAGTLAAEGRGFLLTSSATISAKLSGVSGRFSWCGYAFDVPPNAKLKPDGSYSLHGTPPFIVNGAILTAGETTFGPGTCITSITDFTYNPAGIVPAPPTIAWASGGEASQSVLIGNAVIPVTFVTAGATSVTPSGLPDGVSGAWSSPDYIVSGTPSATGTITYTLTAAPPTGCDNTTVSGTITVVPPGANQPQGSCTFTQPDVVNTFTAFPATYSASTFVTLVDERDGNNYTVVKMPDGKWWTAQNLNYQKELNWNQQSARANNADFTTAGAGTAAIGSFWCPAGNAANTVTSSPDRAGCRLYGALYTYETAMMVDGKWSNESHTNSDFSEPRYGIATNAGNTNNGARGGTRGICPPNWHVPTDAEWGNMLQYASTLSTNFNTGANIWIGQANNAGEAGARLKAKCTCPSTEEFCATDDVNAWRYTATSSNVGTDVYGFWLVPAGYRSDTNPTYIQRGMSTTFWTSSAYSKTHAWHRNFLYQQTNSGRYYVNRSSGFVVRCVMD